MTAIFENATLEPIASLRAFHRNPRRGDTAVIADSLRLTGQYRPIIVNRGTLTGRKNEVLAGNHTLAAAKELGWDAIAVTWLDVNEEVAKRIVLADNRTADLGGYDDTMLVELLGSMADLAGTGYDGDDLLALMGDTFEEPTYRTHPDEVPDPPEDPVSARGEVWALGPHKIICGDATDPTVLAKLMGTERADALWTDPPYGVEYVGKTRDKLTIRNDDKAGLAHLILDSFQAAKDVALRPGAPFYCAHADTERVTFQTAIEAAGFRVRQNLVWAKNTIVLGRSDYHYKHEPILYGFTPGGEGRLGRGGPHWFGDNAQATVFNFDKPAASREHPTQKPIDLIKAMLTNSADRGDLVLDLFGGSGSTLVAADSLGIRARIVELDPRYVDVVINRYQRLTGVAAELLEAP